MIALTLAQVAQATAGQLVDGAQDAAVVTGPVVTDSREAARGALFVAMPGERVDGHDFAARAVAAGAVAALATRPVGVPAVLVDDPVAALGRLARAVCDRLPELTVVGVTGSSGKTSTKDLLAHLLDDLGPTVAPVNSYNNEIGLPLTALRCTQATRFLVSEMGARHPGNISYLCRITPPAIAVVLNVGSAHLGEFGSQETIARTKGELPEAVGPQGVAVLNLDDPLVRVMASRTPARTVWTGRDPQAHVRAADVQLDPQARARFTLHTPQGSAPVQLRLHGAHHVANALAAAAVAGEVGLPVARIAELLSTAEPASRWRMAVHERADGLVLINDSYNANPESVRAALDALATMAVPATGAARRRTWAVLGEMLELGPAAQDAHADVGRHAAALRIDRVVAVGPGTRPIADGAAAAGSSASYVPTLDQARDLLTAQLGPGDVVLVKASRAIGLDRLAAALVDPPSSSVAALAGEARA